MAKGKDGGKPSERISDEVYSTPSVKKVGIAPKQRKKTKKLTVRWGQNLDEVAFDFGYIFKRVFIVFFYLLSSTPDQTTNLNFHKFFDQLGRELFFGYSARFV